MGGLEEVLGVSELPRDWDVSVIGPDAIVETSTVDGPIVAARRILMTEARFAEMRVDGRRYVVLAVGGTDIDEGRDLEGGGVMAVAVVAAPEVMADIAGELCRMSEQAMKEGA